MIIGCEHHSGMGLCSQCSREASESVARSSRSMKRYNQLMEASYVCESEGLYEAARTLREKAKSA